jgi:8-oxo-dGTP pyrophosphatase MutT (NUDIX family)
LWTDPNETPAEAAVREVIEETGVMAVVLGEPGFAHTAVQGHASLWAVIERDVTDFQGRRPPAHRLRVRVPSIRHRFDRAAGGGR